MKAVLCKSFGAPDQLTVEDLASPPVKRGEVKIRVRACGVNFPDALMIQGLYQLKPSFPFSPGLEVAGDIIEVGQGVDAERVGQRIMATMMFGGFAEEVVVPQSAALPMPENMSYESGAGFPLVYGTAHVALSHRARLQAGETLLVLGAAGGVGLAGVEIGKLIGARVIAAASSAQKLALARSRGADEAINYSDENLRDRVKSLTEDRGADVIFDPVGGSAYRLGGSLSSDRIRQRTDTNLARQYRLAKKRVFGWPVLGRLPFPGSRRRQAVLPAVADLVQRGSLAAAYSPNLRARRCAQCA